MIDKNLLKEYLFIMFMFSSVGMCGLIYQVLWGRMLGLIFGHTTFAISTVITAFMGGLALGSYFLGRWADSDGKIKHIFRKIGGSPDFLMYGFLETFIGIYCLFTPVLFNIVESIYLQFSYLPFYTISIIRFILCMIVLIVPTFCMGGTLPYYQNFS
jgi:spermidine synthase